MIHPEILVKDERIVRLAEIVEAVKQSEEWEDAKMSIYSVGVNRGKAEAIILILDILGLFSEELKNKIVSQEEAVVMDDWLNKDCAARSVEDFVKSIGEES